MDKAVKDSKDQLIIKAKKVKGDDGYKVFSIRVKEELIASIDELAEKTGRSRNELIGIFIEFGLDRCIVDYDE